MDTIDLRTQPTLEAIAGSLMSMIEAGQRSAGALPVSASATLPPSGLVEQLADARLALARVEVERLAAAHDFDVALAELLSACGRSADFERYRSSADQEVER